jgi:hypothetical protein
MTKQERDKLQDAFIEEVLASMDMQTLLTLVQEHLEAEFNQVSDEDLLAQVQEHYPELLDNTSGEDE